jgi:hypothetical protein
MSYGDRFDQSKVSERHGAGAKAQSSDATGTTDDLAGFLTDGTLTAAGIKASEVLTSSSSGRGRWYMQIPVGPMNGANVDFYTDFVPISPPTGTPAEVPFQLVQNGRILSPYKPWYSLAPASNHLVMTVPPKATDEFVCYYFTGDAGETPSTQPPDTLQITLWAAFIRADGTSPGEPGTNYSNDGGTSWSGINPTLLLGDGTTFPSAPFSLQQITYSISPAPTNLSQFRLRYYCKSSGGTGNFAPDEFRIYDVQGLVTYPDGSTTIIRPSSFSHETPGGGGFGNVVDGALAYDSDSGTPSTYGYVTRTRYSTFSDPELYVLTGWS